MKLFSLKKRAQAAVELLTTYGWAIMGVILVIGALSYFDVFDAKRFISEKCDTGNQIQCLEAFANDDGEFRVAIRNNYLVDIVVEGIYVDGAQLEYFDGDYFIGTSAIPMTSGNISQFGMDDMTELMEGNKKTMNVVVTFRRDIAGIDDCEDAGASCYNTSGTLVVKVQDADDGIVPKDEDN